MLSKILIPLFIVQLCMEGRQNKQSPRMAKASHTKKATKKAAPKKAAPAKKKPATKPAEKPQAQTPPPGSIRTHQLTMEERKQYAEMLFMRGDIEQQEIARIVQVSANTITKWVNDE